MNVRALKRLSLMLPLLGGLSACIAPAMQPPPPPSKAQTHVQALPLEDVDLVGMSHAIGDALAAELRKNRPNFNKRKPVLATTFVNLGNLDSSSELGLILSDQVAARFTQHGYAMVETKMRSQIAIQPKKGEFILSRDIEKLSHAHKAYAVLVGTYSTGTGVVYLTTKLVQIKNNQVLASVNAKLPMGTTTRDLLIETGCCETMGMVGS